MKSQEMEWTASSLLHVGHISHVPVCASMYMPIFFSLKSLFNNVYAVELDECVTHDK